MPEMLCPPSVGTPNQIRSDTFEEWASVVRAARHTSLCPAIAQRNGTSVFTAISREGEIWSVSGPEVFVISELKSQMGV